MPRKDKSEPLPKCWSQRLWWVFLLLGVLLAYLVLQNFTLSFWPFLVLLLAIVGGSIWGGNLLGTWIDKNHRTEKGLARQEKKTLKVLRKWLRGVARRKKARLDAETSEKLARQLVRLDEAIADENLDLARLREERRRCDQLIEDNLGQFRKSANREYIEAIGGAVLIALLLRAFVLEAFQIPSGSMIPSLWVGDHIFVNKLSYGMRVPLLPMNLFGERVPALAFNWSMPNRGDVVVFVNPSDNDQDYIKRVVAIEGDTIEVKDGHVFVNGVEYGISGGTFGDFIGYEEREDRYYDFNAYSFEESIPGREHSILRYGCDSISCRGPCQKEIGVCVGGDFSPQKVMENHIFVMGDNRENSQDSRYIGQIPMNMVKGRAIFIWWSYDEHNNKVAWNRMFSAIR